MWSSLLGIWLVVGIRLCHPTLLSLMFGSGRRSVDCTSKAARPHGFHASSPLVCDRMRGSLIENLMMLLIDLGS